MERRLHPGKQTASFQSLWSFVLRKDTWWNHWLQKDSNQQSWERKMTVHVQNDNSIYNKLCQGVIMLGKWWWAKSQASFLKGPAALFSVRAANWVLFVWIFEVGKFSQVACEESYNFCWLTTFQWSFHYQSKLYMYITTSFDWHKVAAWNWMSNRTQRNLTIWYFNETIATIPVKAFMKVERDRLSILKNGSLTGYLSEPHRTVCSRIWETPVLSIGVVLNPTLK